MARFNIDLASHAIHSFFQRGKFSGLAIAIGAGVVVGGAFFASALYQVSHTFNAERDASLARLAQSNSSIAALKKELAIQGPALQNLTVKPKAEHEDTLPSSGFSEDDVNYWRKQMDAFAKMTGVQMNIVGRGPSRYMNAIKINVHLALSNTGSFTGLTNVDLIKALDFLQLYGYVESFNGTEAVVHIPEVKKS